VSQRAIALPLLGASCAGLEGQLTAGRPHGVAAASAMPVPRCHGWHRSAAQPPRCAAGSVWT